MNLVAKEYVARHPGDGGSLVLSEFAGAASELEQAYSVNPYDLNGMKDVFKRALTDPDEERAKRMRALKEQVSTHTIERWADSLLGDLAGV